MDLLLKKPVIDGARALLSSANVTYEIVIEDLQEAIANENPPKEVIEQFQNRKGECVINGTGSTLLIGVLVVLSISRLLLGFYN